MRILPVIAAVVLTLVMAACGGDSGAGSRSRVVETVVVEREVYRDEDQSGSTAEQGWKGVAGPPGMPGSAPAPMEMEGEEGGFADHSDEMKSAAADPGQGVNGLASNLDREVAAAAAQERVIVRTVDAEIRVLAVQQAIEDISTIATGFGGWVVSTEQNEKHRGAISVRVPADRLDEARSDIRALAAEVESERVTSQDFTEEYTDTGARVRNLESTEAALLKLFDRAFAVEDAIKVQTELTKVQDEMERLTGRLKLLEQTSAYSLVNVRLQAVPAEMTVDAGEDKTIAVGRWTQFRATLVPPEGIEDFVVTWDFGDGSPLTTVTRTASTLEEGTRITAPASHVYEDDTDSPFIVSVEIEGSGEAGLSEGSDTLIATVSEIPVIEVFAGDSITVEEGEEVEFSGSFTRPEGLDELTFEWDFGDGSTLAEGTLGPGVTIAAATHVYPNHRPQSFAVTLKVEGETEAGTAEGSSTVHVYVQEGEGLVVGGWAPGDTLHSATRALASLAAVAVRVLIWMGILSPIWAPAGIIVFWLLRRRRRDARGDNALGAPPPPPSANSAGTA